MALKRRYNYNGEHIYEATQPLITNTISSSIRLCSSPQEPEIPNITRRLSAKCPPELAALSDPSLSAKRLISSSAQPPGGESITDDQTNGSPTIFRRSSVDDGEGCGNSAEKAYVVDVSDICGSDQAGNGKIDESFVQKFYDGLEDKIFDELSYLRSVPKYTWSQRLDGDVIKDNGDYASHLLPISEVQHHDHQIVNRVLNLTTLSARTSFVSYFFYANERGQISTDLPYSRSSTLDSSTTPPRVVKDYITDNLSNLPVCFFEPSSNSLRLSIKFRFKCKVQDELCRRYCRASHFNNSCRTIAKLGLHKLLRKQALRDYDISFLVTDWHVSARARSLDAVSQPYSLASSSCTSITTCRARETLETDEPIDTLKSSRQLAKDIVDYIRGIANTAEAMVKAIDENAAYMADCFVQKIDAIIDNSSCLRTRENYNRKNYL